VPAARTNMPPGLDNVAAHAEHGIKQVCHDAHMVGDDPHLIANRWTPGGVADIEDTVLLAHPDHGDFRMVKHRTVAAAILHPQWFTAERFGAGIDNDLSRHGVADDGGEDCECAVFPATRTHRIGVAVVVDVGPGTHLRQSWHVVHAKRRRG
jgi:hypothetical protein